MAFADTRKLKKILRHPQGLKRIHWIGNRGFALGGKEKVRRHGKAVIFYSKDLPPDFQNPEYESSNPYQLTSLQLIDRYRDGLVLDLGAGNPKFSFPNVCQVEIRQYPETDIVVGEGRIPLCDTSVDAVISEAVLEHVKDPFLHIAEIHRVLKPGGEVLLDSAFMQPLHGYPSHYFNTTASALRHLMHRFSIQDLKVGPHQHPWITLQWILNSFWFGFNNDGDRDVFRAMTVGQVMDLLTSHQEKRSKIKRDDDAWRIATELRRFNETNRESLGCFMNVSEKFTEELAAGFQVYAKKPH